MSLKPTSIPLSITLRSSIRSISIDAASVPVRVPSMRMVESGGSVCAEKLRSP
jgi:hypothetical protein